MADTPVQPTRTTAIDTRLRSDNWGVRGPVCVAGLEPDDTQCAPIRGPSAELHGETERRFRAGDRLGYALAQRGARGASMVGTRTVASEPGVAFEADRLIRLLATDAYDLHRLVYLVFARDGVRDFLFAPLRVSGELQEVLVRCGAVATRFAQGHEFDLTLRAMPAVKHAGKRRSIGAARGKDPLRLRWIHARAREHGFELLADPEMQVERVRLEAAKRPFGFNACRYRAPVRVTEAGRFTRAYARGIGQGRAWGCGMMILSERGVDGQ